jgi:beta-N-acetylhexosaminidase
VGDVRSLLEEAEWVVFAMFDPNPRYADSDALQLFLAQNAHRIYDVNVVVLAYTAPYYLDATEISKLTAYYVLYSKTQPFVEASVRTLFGEVRPQGRSPVSIEGTYYDLGTQLSPDPAQQVTLDLIEPAVSSAYVPVTLRVRTNGIRDRNGNPVPDGTLVRFAARVSQPGAASESGGQIVDTSVVTTVGGVAETELTVDRPGRVAVVAGSGETGEGRALVFEALQQPTPTALPPTRVPTRTPTLVPTVGLTPTRPLTQTPVQTPNPTPSPLPSPTLSPMPGARPLSAALDAWTGRPLDLPGLLGGWVLAAGVGYLLWGRSVRRGALRMALGAWVGGLAGYLVYGWQWVSLGRWLGWPAWVGGGVLAFCGALVLVAILGTASRRES